MKYLSSVEEYKKRKRTRANVIAANDGFSTSFVIVEVTRIERKCYSTRQIIILACLPECASRSSIKLADTISETTSGTVSDALLNSNLISCKSP